MIYCFHNHTQSNKISYHYKKRIISVLREHVQYIARTIFITQACTKDYKHFDLIITKKGLPVDVAQIVQLLSLEEFHTQQS